MTDSPVVPIYNYVIALPAGKYDLLKGAGIDVIDGALVVKNARGAYDVIYASGTWLSCGLEEDDDQE